MQVEAQLPLVGASPDTPPRLKRQQARSSGGCGNCKKRKVKCDERKPSCLRCQTRRLTCLGYSTDTFKWSYKHEIYKSIRQTDNASPGSPCRPIEVTANSVQDHNPLGATDTWDIECADFATLRPSTSGSDGTTSSPFAAETLTYGHGNSWASSSSEMTSPKRNFDTIPLMGDTNVEQLEDNCQHLNPIAPDSTRLCARTSIAHIPLDLSLSALSPARSSTSSGPGMIDGSALSLPRSLLHVPTVLVEHYFQKVCRECSTFDSSYNPFRTMVAEMRTHSASLNYTIQSLAAAKLVDDLPGMKMAGIEAQGLALESLKQDCSAVGALHKVPDAVLCTILLLGMTTSWHFPDDIGLEYLALARRVVIAKAVAQDPASDLEFYQNALKYWTMIASIVTEDADTAGAMDSSHTTTIEPSPVPSHAKVFALHPWTGVSPEPVELFGETLKAIRRTRGARSKAAPIYSRASIKDISMAITAAEQLEAKCLAVSIPSTDRLSEFGDLNTPRIDHVLTAKAYLLSSLLQIYLIFPDVLESRIHSFLADTTMRCILDADKPTSDLPHILSTKYMWARRRAGDSRSLWLRDIGLYIVECLEQINVKSGTRVVHSPLLLSVANALTLPPDSEHEAADLCDPPCIPLDPPEDLDFRVRCCRSFIVNRLETMHALMRFRAIDNVLIVVKEVWRRADAGSNDVFWMDIMHELRCETLFG